MRASRYPVFTRSLDALRNRLSLIPRSIKKGLFVALDFVVLIGLVWLSMSLRLQTVVVPNPGQALLMLAVPVVSIPVFIRMGIYRSVLRYLPERAIWTILRAVTVSVLIWVAVAFLTQVTGIEGIPRSIPLILWAAECAYLICSRFGAKWLLWGDRYLKPQARRTLIYGTGDAGVQLVHALKSTRERQLIGMVTEDRSLSGMEMLGLRIYQPSDIERLVVNMGVQEVIITASSMTKERRDLVARLSLLPAEIRVLPPVADLAAGRYLISSVRDIDIDDLLGRSAVLPDPKLLRQAVTGQVVMVTGAAGSIGLAVCRIVTQLKPARLIMFDFDEHGLYQADREFAGQKDLTVVPVLGSVANRQLLDIVLRENAVDVVFHCAAYKHVTLVEANVIEGVGNNVFGTWTLADAARRAGVKKFVLISSDKAVRPASVMGATKRWSELIMEHFGRQADRTEESTVFSTVRFGNVIGSSGSVVPLFKEQIARGGPVTITHDDMTRYFMSVREAAELIVQATALSESTDIFLLEMGEPIRIRELAEDMVALAGLRLRTPDNPDGDIEIISIGPRPGEKIAEELFYDPASVTPTAHPKILRARRRESPLRGMPEKLEALKAALDAEDVEEVRRMLFDFVRVLDPVDRT